MHRAAGVMPRNFCLTAWDVTPSAEAICFAVNVAAMFIEIRFHSQWWPAPTPVPKEEAQTGTAEEWHFRRVHGHAEASLQTWRWPCGAGGQRSVFPVRS